MEEIVRCMDCGYCDVEPWGAWCNKENAQLNDVCDEHKCDSFFQRIKKEASYQQLSKALCGKENATLDEMLEAAEQLKHRAEPELSPLTLEEATESEAPVWLEAMGKVRIAQINLSPGESLAEYKTIGRGYAEYLYCGDYGILWRCWPRKPTPEQMTAAKWEE